MAFEKIVGGTKKPHTILQLDIRCHKCALQRGRQSLADATGGISNNRKIKYIIGTWIETKFYPFRDCCFLKVSWNIGIWSHHFVQGRKWITFNDLTPSKYLMAFISGTWKMKSSATSNNLMDYSQYERLTT